MALHCCSSRLDCEWMHVTVHVQHRTSLIGGRTVVVEVDRSNYGRCHQRVSSSSVSSQVDANVTNSIKQEYVYSANLYWCLVRFRQHLRWTDAFELSLLSIQSEPIWWHPYIDIIDATQEHSHGNIVLWHFATCTSANCLTYVLVMA